MNCLLFWAGACLLDPGHVEVRADVSYQLAGDFDYFRRGINHGGGHLGMLELGAGGDLGRGWSVRYGLRHTSLYDVTDGWGDNRVFVGFTWRPYGR